MCCKIRKKSSNIAKKIEGNEEHFANFTISISMATFGTKNVLCAMELKIES